ncbi:MAG: 7-carboxy-7-deazaguanine synthase QueE [Candidatus Omnitrophica bacterium]|nr:7-carboxy-7-deazaguanine synthase QueE [Candidatus Omnitrophota bacterium]
MLPVINSRTADLTEIFASIQGEGVYVGVPQIFIRFNQCNLACEYCDTPINVPGRAAQTLEQITRSVQHLCSANSFHSFSLTGGEPLLYAVFLKRLIPLVKKWIPKCYLETNGVLAESLLECIDFVDIIAMDIKLPSALNGAQHWRAHERFLETAMKKEIFIKVVITEKTLLDEWRQAVELVSAASPDIPMVLQPATAADGTLRTNMVLLAKWQQWARQKVKDVRILPQVHKMIGVR